MNGIGNKIAQFIFQQIVKQQFVAGNRMYIGGAVGIIGGLLLIAEMVVSGKYDEVKMGVAWAGIGLGYKTIGEAGKQDARTAALLTAARTQATETKVAATKVADTLVVAAEEIKREPKEYVVQIHDPAEQVLNRSDK